MDRFDYFYGAAAEQFSFYRIPRQLIIGAEFRCLSDGAKLLYGLMLDRMGLSAKNGWADETGRVYIYYTLEDIKADLGCGADKAVKLLAELDGEKGIGLIERRKPGQGRPTIIYVKQFIARSPTPESSGNAESRSQDFGKAEVKTSEKPKSRNRKSRSADFGKADTSNTYVIQPEVNQPKSIHPSSEMDGLMDAAAPPDELDLLEEVEEILLAQKSIPMSYTVDRQRMTAAVHALTEWVSLYPSGYADELEQSVYELFNAALVDMLTSNSTLELCGAIVSSAAVLEATNRCLDVWDDVVIVRGLMDDVIADYVAAERERKIKHRHKYMQSMIWSALQTHRLRKASMLDRVR